MGIIPNLLVKYDFAKKLMSCTIAVLLLLVTFSIMMIPIVSAGSGEIEFYLRPSSNTVDAMDNFNITVNVNTTDNVNVSWYNVSLLTYNETSLYMANTTANDIYFLNWIENTNQYTINNDKGNITNINGSISTNLSGNKTAFIINYTAQSCGLLYINMSDISAMENVTGQFGSITWNNITVEIHPQKPQNFQAQVINSTAVNLSFSKGVGTDNIIIERNTAPSWQRGPSGSGTELYNGTASFFVDEGLSPETQYYYQAWSWNNTNNWYSTQNSSLSKTTSQNGIFINGTVVNFSDNTAIENVEIRVDGQNGQNITYTNSMGYFELNLSQRDGFDGPMFGPGNYFLEIEKQGYANYMKWDMQLNEDQYKQLGTIPLPKLFADGHEATIQGYVSNETEGLANTEVMLLNMNFSYMVEKDGKEGEMGSNTTTNETGYFEINAPFPGIYSLIAFSDGYYAKVNGTYTISNEDQVNWTNITLDAADPDDLDITINFTDLDDATVTVNRTIRAESPVIRYALDIMPGGGGSSGGNSNGIVSSSEVSSFLMMLSMSGPGFSIGEEESSQPDEEEMGGPDFLSLPFEFVLDGSPFDDYISGSHNGTLTNLANTNASDNTSIYYNGTFNITLDGKIANDAVHSFNITTEHNNTMNTTLTILYNGFYNITDNASSTKVTIVNTTTNLTMIPGENETSSLALAYANITLEFNQTQYSLPIIEVPTWNITDRWGFQKTGEGFINYTLTGKPLRRWDRWDYYRGDEQNQYLCYQLSKQNDTMANSFFVTINDLQWLTMDGENLNLSCDLDFPLYGDKTWDAITWWGAPANAQVISTDISKITSNGTISNCVQINYTNATGVCGQQWYSPAHKFFVNRTQNVSGATNVTWNFTEFSLGPFIESATIGNITDVNGKIEYLYSNLSINITHFYDDSNDFVLEGILFKENFTGPPEDIMWVFYEGNKLTNIQKNSTPVYINLTYDGGVINASGVNGPYTGNLELRKDHFEGGDDFFIDMIDYYSFEADYNSNEFISPAVWVENINVEGNDTNGDGSYDFLTLNATLNASETGTYRINAGLDKIIDRGGWQDWRWITGAGSHDFAMTAGQDKTVSLNFNGMEIYEQGYDGPFNMHLEIQNTTTFTSVYQGEQSIAHSYQYNDFATPSVYFNKEWFNQSMTHDYLNASTFLTINTSIMVSDSSGIGDYELCGSIHIGNLSNEDEWGRFIAGKCNDQISLSLGENRVPLNFDLGEVRDRLSQESGDNHTLKVDLSLSERVGDWIGPEIDYTTYYTQNYSMNDLPDPPISLIAYNDQVTNDNLNISVNLTVNGEEYTNRTYELHGGVHHNNTSDEHWVFITGNCTEVTVNGPGSYDIYFHFSGMEISGCNEDGKYNIWLGLDKLPEYEMVADAEYTTSTSYDADQDFAKPDVQFNDSNTTAEKWGSENFAVNVSLLVENPGDYHIGGGIHYVEHMDGWDNWVFLDGFGKEYPLTSNRDITLNFSQSIINSGLPSDYNGPLVVHMGIENATNWQHIDHIEYETSQSYSKNDFSGSAVVINSTDVFINNEGNLQLNVTYYATSEQTCNVHGGVHDSDWWFITGEWLGSQTLAVGENNLSINFSGSQIFNSMKDPVKIWFGIEKTSNYQLIANKELTLTGYTYQNFSAATSGLRIIRENMSDESVDYMNSTGSKTYLTVNVSINVTSSGAGDYWIDGGLDYVQNDNYEFITGTGREITLTTGNHTIPLNFRASEIRASGKSGNFKAWIGIRDMKNNWEDVDSYEYTTSYYDASDAPAPPVSIVDKTDGSTDIAFINTTNENYLSVNVTLNVQSGNAGTYDLHGGVNYRTNDGWWQHISGTGDWIELTEGQNDKVLNFNGGDIKNKLPDGYTGNLSVWIGLNDVTDWEEISHTEYITREFSKAEFPGAKITMTGNNESVWGENFTVNLTINTSAEFSADTYEIHGGLNYIETTGGWDEWRFITGFHDEISLNDDEEITYSCNFSAGEVYSALENNGNKTLTAWIAIENKSTWNELAHVEYESANQYWTGDLNPPTITIECRNDTYNDSADCQCLQVNVTINNTDGFDGTVYEVHSGIHYTEDMGHWEEWRFITGFHRRISPSAGNSITIPLNFSGTALYESGETGPFEVWVGISREGEWDDLAHYEYTTDDYTGESFAEPEIRIIESNITDYVNENGDLTINVSVKKATDGQLDDPNYEYILEGCIHWKQGHQWKWISWSEKYFNNSDYATNEYNVTLNFTGKELKKAAEDGWTGGNLVAWFAIRNTTTWSEVSRVDEYETQNSYSPSDFSDAPVTFDDSQYITEELVNTSGDALYEFFNVTVPLNITTSTGTYKIFAGLFDAANNTFVVGKSKSINLASSSVTLNFSGEKINRKAVNITSFKAKIFDETNKMECDHYENDTSQTYLYSEFTTKPAEATIAMNYSNTSLDDGDLVISVNISIDASGVDENFKLYGDLSDNTSSTFITKAKNTTIDNGSAGEVSVNLTFDKTAILESGISAPYKLSYLELSIYDDAEEIWEPLAIEINPYWTQEGYYTG